MQATEELVSQSRTWPLPFEHDDLLAQCQDLQAMLVAAADEGVKVEEQGNNELAHESLRARNRRQKRQ